MLGCKNNKDRVYYVALNNLSSANFEIAFKGKRKWRDLSASTVTGDQIKSDVVGNANFRIAPVNFPISFV